MTSNDHEAMLTLPNVSKELESKLSDIVKSIVEKAISAFIISFSFLSLAPFSLFYLPSINPQQGRTTK